MKITVSQIHEAIRALGLDPDDTAHVVLQPGRVTVVRYARNTAGNRYVDPNTMTAATAFETIEITA